MTSSSREGKAKWLEPISISEHPNLYSYSLDHGLRELPVQRNLRDKIEPHRRANYSSPPDESQFLAMLVRLLHAKKVIEVGVFMGYTTLTMAMSLPNDGKILACDVSSEYTEVAMESWKEAKVDHKIDLKLAPAEETLSHQIKEGHENTFDLAFIDADKINYDKYYEQCLKLIKPGGIIAVDNVFWHGKVLLPESEHDTDTKAIAALNTKIKNDNRVKIVILPIGDGLTLCEKI